MNKIVLTGNVTNDIELRYTTNNKPVCNFGLAVKRNRADEVEFLTIVAWNKLAEGLSKYIGKGDKLLVYGELVIKKWSQDGVKREKCEIVAENIEFLKYTKKENVSVEDNELQSEENVDDEEFQKRIDNIDW